MSTSFTPHPGLSAVLPESTSGNHCQRVSAMRQRGAREKLFLTPQASYASPASSAARLALSRVERARLELAIEEARGVDRAGQSDPAGWRRLKSHAGIVGLVADQDDERPSRRLGRLERTGHERLADPLETEYRLDDER